MTKLTLEAIEVIDAIARSGSFSAAGELLHRVPSTMSYTVAKIEEQLEFALFERNGPRVSLTAAGEELLKEGRWLLRAAGELESRLRRVATGYESELRIVHDSLIPTSALIDDIRAFAAIDCGTRLRITKEALTGCWEALTEGRADLIIAADHGPSGGGYRAEPVGRVEFVFCIAPNHELARARQPLSMEDLAGHTAIVVADSARTLAPREIGLLSVQQRITVADIATKIALQKAGLGYGFLPRVCVERDLREATLVELAVREPKPDETFWLACHPSAQGEALKWWWKRLQGELMPALLPSSAKAAPNSMRARRASEAA